MGKISSAMRTSIHIRRKRKNPQEKSIARKGGILNHSDLFYVLDEKIVRSGQEKKNIYFCFIDYAKAFDCVDHSKLENS